MRKLSFQICCKAIHLAALFTIIILEQCKFFVNGFHFPFVRCGLKFLKESGHTVEHYAFVSAQIRRGTGRYGPRRALNKKSLCAAFCLFGGAETVS
jgi:hypothetical protein